MEGKLKVDANYRKIYSRLLKCVICISTLLLLLILFRNQNLTSISLISRKNGSGASHSDQSSVIETMAAKLRESVTFLPLKDLRFSETAMIGNTWFMSSLNDSYEMNEAEYLYFPSEVSKGRLLCIRGRDMSDGTKNFYALAWRESLPNNATLLSGLTYVSNTYYNYLNLWHGLCAMTPFVRWTMKNKCIKPDRWVLFHWGELEIRTGSWIQQLMLANYGEFKFEGFDKGDGPYCFEKAVVMRHDLGSMGLDNKLKVYDMMRCKAREFCNLFVPERSMEVDERGLPVIRLTLLMRRGSRSFKNATLVTDIFSRECDRAEGCVLKVFQSEDLSFCDQVKVMTYTDVVASPHGAQLTNMFFMDRGSSVMEFFPKGWLEHAGVGQYAHHWMANQSGMKHQGAWCDSTGEDCPTPKDDRKCFLFHKDGKVGVNETYFAEWIRKVLHEVRVSKLEATKTPIAKEQLSNNVCAC
ncbi:hypothetical protein DCAR_0626462 [Daucus carota subsp. sativus]|uniref:Glycosyltransferase 61 catalytic domain-containing protein n=1 Tax=Daucus carota subsp. sativus TaxID=79200 RepID=A0AAF0XFK7_DAUCS|nr:PREDICTED: uncharacterized protein LOC108226351 [Daucus carota subsp. sativus]WOH07033.1 hypothetical protein DCAR_0626462 [Daucus carota subsp. sativus]